jgi:hypothetical protein
MVTGSRTLRVVGRPRRLSGRRRAWASNVTGMVAITTFQIQASRCSTSAFCPVVTELRSEQASGLTVTHTLFDSDNFEKRSTKSVPLWR